MPSAQLSAHCQGFYSGNGYLQRSPKQKWVYAFQRTACRRKQREKKDQTTLAAVPGPHIIHTVISSVRVARLVQNRSLKVLPHFHDGVPGQTDNDGNGDRVPHVLATFAEADFHLVTPSSVLFLCRVNSEHHDRCVDNEQSVNDRWAPRILAGPEFVRLLGALGVFARAAMLADAIAVDPVSMRGRRRRVGLLR
ncbi:hypothetical protein CCHR01_00085 [Colletotrichum chrysophilum]|uniref:Uncharacterized protein n=1 Tax=Colletotrichum chrysophilum TaxID=1836956 RepID=A0AAD9B1Z9_9PEZI|nr:hypothetical protein CCHR01_00085 [Colletotrichum chrysophilum]